MPQIKDFNIINLSTEVAAKVLITRNDSAINGNDRYQFCLTLSNIFSRYGVVRQAQNEILALYKQSIPQHISLPDKESFEEICSSFGVDDVLIFDCCVGGCCVYAGSENDVKYFCGECSHPRYKPCTVCKSTDSCSHWQQRTPFASLHYRPIIPLLTRLVCFDEFIKAMEYVDGDSVDHDRYHWDVKSSVVATQHLEQMTISFQQKHYPPEVTMVNILFSHFYDGCQVHRSKVTTFWPIYISILNLPPPLRGKLGIGTFLLALLTIEKSRHSGEAAAEDFLYYDCFARELERLHEGIEVYSSPSKRYYIQARLIMHCLDSKAIEKFLKVQGAGSLAGCPLCRTKKGVCRADLDKVVIIDHRDMLPYKHYLRQVGQSGLCCHENYYKENNLLALANNYLLPSFDTKKNLSAANIADVSEANREKFKERVCAKEDSSYITDFLVQAQYRNGTKTLRDFEWHHDDNTVSKGDVDKIFGNQLFFPHCNYRPYMPLKRVTNYTYVKDGLIFLLNRKTQIEANPTTKIKSIKTDPVDGVKGLWPFAHLPYSDVSQMICWDPFHVFTNISKNILGCLKGDRANSLKIAKYCMMQGCHPSLHGLCNNNSNHQEDNMDNSNKPTSSRKVSKPTTPVWVLSKGEQRQAEEYINCIVVPTGSKQNMEVCSPFTRTGQLKGVGHMQLITTYMDYMLSATKLGVPYKRFLSMLSYDIALLLQPVILDSELETISKQIVELLCIKESLFPDSEGTFSWHTLVDIPLHIRQFGPVKGWWTLYGERAMSVLKEFVPQGGASFYKTVLDRYIKHEVSTMNKMYNSAQELFDTAGEGHLKYGVNTDFYEAFNFPYIYKGRMEAKNKRDDCLMKTLTTFDLYYILEMIFIEVERRCKSFAAAIKVSSIYYCARYYNLYILSKEKASNSNHTSFISRFIRWCVMDGDALSSWVALNRELVIPAGHYRAQQSSDTVIMNAFENQLIYIECIEAAFSLKKIKVKMFKFALVANVKLRGRGWEFRESNNPTVESNYGREQRHVQYIPVNENCNKLRKCWSRKDQYSSWCALQTDELIIGDISDKWKNANLNQLFERVERKLFAQINSFMLLTVEHEPFLTNYPLVSVTCRYYETVNNVHKVSAQDKESYVENRHFVPFYHVLPTQIAVAGFIKSTDANHVDKPIYLGNQSIDGAEGSECYHHSFTKQGDIDYLVLIPMEPLAGMNKISSLSRSRTENVEAAQQPHIVEAEHVSTTWMTMVVVDDSEHGP
jgi:hypothetical protein